MVAAMQKASSMGDLGQSFNLSGLLLSMQGLGRGHKSRRGISRGTSIPWVTLKGPSFP